MTSYGFVNRKWSSRLKNFVLNYYSYLILIIELYKSGETHIIIQLLTRALQIANESKDGDFTVRCCYNSILGTAEVRDNVKANDASYHSIIDRLYKGRTRSVVMIKIIQNVDELHVEHYNLVTNK